MPSNLVCAHFEPEVSKMCSTIRLRGINISDNTKALVFPFYVSGAACLQGLPGMCEYRIRAYRFRKK